jgi:aquaporin NIP
LNQQTREPAASRNMIRQGHSSMQRYLAEFIGTFILVFTGVGAAASGSLLGDPVQVGIALVFGLTVMVIINAIGDISGAHINPAVTIAFCVSRRFPVGQVVPYIIAQMAGAAAAGALVGYAFDPTHAAAGLTIPNPKLGSNAVVISFIYETVMTFFLMFVILNVSTGSKEKGVTAAIAIGAVIAVDALFGGPVCGASMNPARSLGPALVYNKLTNVWIYIAAPILGALLGIGAAAAIRPGVCCSPEESRNP